SLEERGGIPHYLIDLIDPWESASVAAYRQWAQAALDEVASAGKKPLFVGGSALYLKALVRGLFQGPSADPNLRARLSAEAAGRGAQVLHARLAALDPRAAARLHPHDQRRVIRALEVIELTGRPMSALQAEHDQPAPPDVLIYSLELPRAALRDRINRRVLNFFNTGLGDEVRTLQSAPHPQGPV